MQLCSAEGEEMRKVHIPDELRQRWWQQWRQTADLTDQSSHVSRRGMSDVLYNTWAMHTRLPVSSWPPCFVAFWILAPVNTSHMSLQSASLSKPRYGF